MGRKPNPLIAVFLNQNVSLPSIHWETVPPGVDVTDAWESFDENVEGWVPVWFPTYDTTKGVSYNEFERAYFFNEGLERILKAMNRWPLWGSETQKKHAVAFALLQLFCEVRFHCPRI